MQTPPLTAWFVHASAEHSYLYFFFRTASVKARCVFFFELSLVCAVLTDDLQLARVEVARCRVEETSADDFFFLASFATAAASAFLSWLSL
jgi:hypothetical protein